MGLESDPLDANSTPESHALAGVCTDGQDNDLDGHIDGNDPGCNQAKRFSFSNTEEQDVAPSVATIDFAGYGFPALGLVALTGPFVVRLDPEGDSDAAGDCSDTAGADGQNDVQTEMVAMQLQGTSPTGPVTVIEDPVPVSQGVVEELAAGTDFPACSFFGMNVRILADVDGDTVVDDIAAGPINMTNPSITQFPPTVPPPPPLPPADPPDLAGVSCADIWLDFAALAAQDPDLLLKGQPHQPGNILVAKALTRIEPSQKQVGAWDITTVTYLGPDTNGDLIPDKPPTSGTCQEKATAATTVGERNTMNPLVKFAAVTNKRPTSTAKIVVKDLGQGPVDTLRSSGCAFSEALKVWIRTDTNSVIVETGPGAKNFGTVVLYLGTGSPTDPNDGTTCEILPETVIFPSYLESHTRDATTDHTGEPKNVALAIVEDPDGPHPKVKFVPQDPDGTTEGPGPIIDNPLCYQATPPIGHCPTTSPTGSLLYADDWDGDGCPDWDELDKSFINGRDPFNPNDCNTKVNYTGTYNILATAFTAAKEGKLTGPVEPVLSVVNKEQKFDPTAAEVAIAEAGAECADAVDAEEENPPDGYINDGCPPVASSPAESGPQCDNDVDDDKDGLVNDGCPAVTTDPTPAETGAQCDNAIDDDKDGAVNDGCPVVGPSGESGIACADALDDNSFDTTLTGFEDDDGDLVHDEPVDDGDGGAINDGCPAVDASPLETGAQCDNAIDDDKDGAINDGCPPLLVDPTPAESGLQCIKGNDVDDDKDGTINDGCPTRGPSNSCNDGKDNDIDGFTDKDDSDCLGKHVSADLKVAAPNSLKNNQKLYWDTDDPAQVGWWQVKQGSIVDQGATKLVTLNRLFVSPCGLVTEGVPPVTAAPALGTLQGVECTGDVQPGNYFHCIARLDEAPDNVLDGNVTCYIDAPLLTITGPPSALPSFADGNAGPPPPPPYATGTPQKLNGFFDKENQQLFLRGCFENVGGSLGPNTVVEVHVDAHSLKGYTDVWFQQTNAACNAKKPNQDELPSLQLETVLSRQNIDFDHDGDGCADYQELGNVEPPKDPPTTKKCGDDPYNPYDSDADANGVISIQVTQIPADWDKALDELIPGFYFHCIANNVHDLGTNAITTTAYCYTDNAVLTVNCEVAGGNVKAAGGCSVNASVCGDPPLAAASECGDGLLGSPPPAPFGDVDGSHPVGTGSYDKVTNIITTDTCFTGVESVIQGPNIYARTKVNIHTGQGTVQIATARANCDKPDFADTGTFPEVLIETAEQPPDWDSDLDGCTNAQELGQNQSAGGLRDPYNQWDFMDTWAGGQQDRRIDGFDIGDVVARFGTVGTPGDPHEPPTASDNYHTAADRNSPLIGSNGWNLTPPDGRIDGFDIGFVVVQFGHTCA